MKGAFLLRGASSLVCLCVATFGLGQDHLPAIPPSVDPAFWGRANKPYSLKLKMTSTSVGGNNVPQTHVSEENVFRDSTGRVRTEDFYDNGKASHVSIRDPDKNTFTGMMVISKTVWVSSVPRPSTPTPGTGATVERLPSRVIDGFPVEGFRFTRTVRASDDGKRPSDRVSEEDWISTTLGVVMEQRVESQRSGTTTRTVSHFEQVEPDPALFTIPSDYTPQQTVSSPSLAPL